MALLHLAAINNCLFRVKYTLADSHSILNMITINVAFEEIRLQSIMTGRLVHHHTTGPSRATQRALNVLSV